MSAQIIELRPGCLSTALASAERPSIRSVPATTFRRIGRQWSAQGGVYAGVMCGRDGAPDYHLIAGPEAPRTLAWQPAMDWAKSVSAGGFSDFALPYRKEQALLFANVPELFKEESYWSCEQHASGSINAWGQSFSLGLQNYWFKGFRLRVRVVRRLIIQ